MPSMWMSIIILERNSEIIPFGLIECSEKYIPIGGFQITSHPGVHSIIFCSLVVFHQFSGTHV